MKILFFPSDLGGGFGHISRCMALAEEAKLRGHECAFVINDRKYFEKLKSSFNLYYSMRYPRWYLALLDIKKRILKHNTSAAPIFTEISSLDYQVIRDGLINEKIIVDTLVKYSKIVEKFQPEILIGDTNLLAWMLSKRVGIPVVQIVRYASHPKTANLVWWKVKPDDMIPPNTLAILNPLMSQMDLNPINRSEDLLQGDLYVVPSIPDIEPIPEDTKTIHVGELTVSNKNAETPSWFYEIKDNLPLIYVTVGGGAGPVGNKRFFSTIIEAFFGKPFQVVVSTSTKFNLESLPKSAKNIRFFNWVPGKLLISRADLVVFHGGYGTMMEIASCGKPAITIPFQTEQEGNGKRLEQLGSGRVLKLSREIPKKIGVKWEFGAYNYFIQESYDLTAEELYRETEKVLNDNKYREKAKELQTKLKNYGGAKKAMESIEQYWA